MHNLICPPALKKYLNWSALANVNVFDTVALLFQPEVEVVDTDESDPSAAAKFLLVFTSVMFCDKAAKAATVSPALG